MSKLIAIRSSVALVAALGALEAGAQFPLQEATIESLHAAGSTHEYKEVDDVSVIFKLASGMHATLATAADASWLFPFERVEVFCHHATLVTREMESLTCSINLEGHFTQQSMQQLSREEKWGYLQEDRAFIDSIINGTPALVTALDGLMSVEIVNAVYESVRTGSPVNICSVL